MRTHEAFLGSYMLQLNIQNETSRLRSVVLGTAVNIGSIPKPEECYDPKSKQHVLAGTYPKEEDMTLEMESVAKVFEKYDVQVFRPEIIKDYNQIFSRDIGFVIEDKFIRANILPDRDREILAIEHVWSQIAEENRITLPEECHVEGGDVMPWNDYIFVGTYSGEDYPNYITARTNTDAVIALQELFPDKIVKPFELRKSNENPKENALHLDCFFQPICKDKAILHKNGFLIEKEYNWLVDFFGKENIFEISKEEMYNMNSNVFSISEDVVISEKNFTRLNTWLRENGFTVEEVPYAEIAKQEGLLRCSTLPLIRD
jgi:N-dimethylarginine dimethylaminohydrolase